MDDQKKYILINGFGWSGSSALIDFMREFEGTFVPHKEFRLIKDPHGVHDLDLSITQSTDQLNEDRAINEFIRFVKIYSRRGGGFRYLGLGYNDDFGENFYNISMSYIKELTDYEYSGHWWYLDYDMPYIKYVTLRSLSRLKLYDYKEHRKMRLTIKGEEEFLKLTKGYITAIFEDCLKGKQCHTVVLDQAIPANRPSWGRRYFNNAKVIVVDRDPRDVYIDLIKEKSLVGYDVAVNHDVQLFIDWFKKVRRPDPLDADYKRIQFEDLILNYDQIIREIYDYCDIDPTQHIYKAEKLKPEVSSKNIGMWKNYQFTNEIRMIEEQLKDYIIQ